MARSKFYGNENGATTKGGCGTDRLENAHELPLPVKRNGWILTGRQPTGKNLAVIMLDAKDGEVLDMNDLDPVSQSTFVVRSGSGGLHVYFYTEREINATQAKPSRHPRAKEIDRRGRGGKAYAPGSQFEGQHMKYAIINDVLVKDITDAEFWRLWNYYADDSGGPAEHPERVRRVVKGKSRHAGKRDFPADRDEVAVESFNKDFPACVNALLTKCEHGIHLRHAERFFITAFMNRAGYPVDTIINIFQYQDDFDRSFTRYQVEQIKKIDYYPFCCKELQGMNMCYSEHCPTANPIDYYTLNADGVVLSRRRPTRCSPLVTQGQP